jgi:hypothetical protein
MGDVMDTWQKGEQAKFKVMLRATEKGIIISEPTIPARYDLILDDGKTLEKVQIKWGGAKSRSSENAVQVELRVENGNGTSRYRKVKYKHGEVDCLLIYIPQIDQIIRLEPEMFVGKTAVVLRLESPLNNQTRNIKMAKDFVW